MQAGTVVSTHYDAMLAKVITWAPDRAAALRRLSAALARTRIAGLPTNRDLLISVLRNPEFAAGGADTSLLDGYDVAALVPDERTCRIAAAAAAAAIAAANRIQARTAATIPGGWRNVPSQPQLTSFDGPRGRLDIRYRWDRTGGIEIAPDRDEADGDGASSDKVGGDGASSDGASAADALVIVEFAPEAVTLEVTGVALPVRRLPGRSRSLGGLAARLGRASGCLTGCRPRAVPPSQARWSRRCPAVSPGSPRRPATGCWPASSCSCSRP